LAIRNGDKAAEPRIASMDCRPYFFE
jgi:hypothetical protein